MAKEMVGWYCVISSRARVSKINMYIRHKQIDLYLHYSTVLHVYRRVVYRHWVLVDMISLFEVFARTLFLVCILPVCLESMLVSDQTCKKVP
jgi:hypothetical protein